jgi:predicted RNase H-like HicB family nuclease
MRVIFEQCEEGGYSASIKEVPGAISQGETIKEAAENVLDALNQLLAAQVEEELEQHGNSKFPLEVELAL